jgi:hypothetical protein
MEGLRCMRTLVCRGVAGGRGGSRTRAGPQPGRRGRARGGRAGLKFIFSLADNSQHSQPTRLAIPRNRSTGRAGRRVLPAPGRGAPPRRGARPPAPNQAERFLQRPWVDWRGRAAAPPRPRMRRRGPRAAHELGRALLGPERDGHERGRHVGEALERRRQAGVGRCAAGAVLGPQVGPDLVKVLDRQRVADGGLERRRDAALLERLPVYGLPGRGRGGGAGAGGRGWGWGCAAAWGLRAGGG